MSDFLPARQGPQVPAGSPVGPASPDRAPGPDGARPFYDAYDAYIGPGESTMRLQRFLSFLRRYWWLPALTTLLGIGAGVAFLFWAPPTYVSTGRMWESEKLRLSEGAAFTEDGQTYYGTHLELLQSDRMLELALDGLTASGTNSIPLDGEGRPRRVQVKARLQPKSTVFYIQAFSADPDYSQAYLNSLMAVFQNYRRTIRQAVSGTTLSSISDQVKRLENDLKQDQTALAAFQKTNNLAILQEEGTVSGGYLARRKTELSDLQLELQLLKATALDQDTAAAGSLPPPLMNSLRSTALGAPGPTAPASERLTAYQNLELLKAQHDKLARFLKPKHPKMVRLDAEIDRAAQLIALHKNQTREQIAAAIQAIEMRIVSIRESVTEWEQKVVETKARIAEAERLRANVTRSQSLYDRLLVLLENVDISRNINQETLIVLEPASVAKRSYKQQIIGACLSACLGLALGLGLILLIEVRDDRFTSTTEITNRFGDSIVGQVPDVSNLRLGPTIPLLDAADAPHMLAESYRSLRSALFYLPAETSSPRVILVTSALPNEGKSTIAANLAKTMALGGARVLLVDADLRRGALHKMLGLKSAPGLAELLAGPDDSMVVAQSNCVPNLTFIARGVCPKSPGDLFMGAAFRHVLARWRDEFDYVIIDSCPVFAADDATAMAPRVDGTLFVVRRSYSGAKAVEAALDLLAQRQAKILGLVFNRADASARSYYYYKHAEYYEGAAGPEDIHTGTVSNS